MALIPFGIPRLDDLIGGGAPAGSVVLLVSETGAGGREFIHTSATMNGLEKGDPELFDLHYGDLARDAEPPPEVHYISFTRGKRDIEREIAVTTDDEIATGAVDEIAFRDLSPEYFQLSPVPREWYVGEARTVADLGRSEGTDDVLEALGAYLGANAAGNLVLIDSISDLVAAISDDLRWKDIAMLIKGLEKASNEWGGLIVLLVNRDTLEPTRLGSLMDSASGTFVFEWETGGSMRARTMVVKSFRGVLSRLEEENIVQFETMIHEGGFDISDVRKIR